MAASGFLYGRKSLGAFKALLNCCTWCYLFSRGCCQTAPRSVRMHIEYEDLSAVKNFICRIGVLLIRSFQLCAFLSFQFGLISFNTRWDEQFYHCYFLCSVNWMNHPLTGSTERGFKKKKAMFSFFHISQTVFLCSSQIVLFFKEWPIPLLDFNVVFISALFICHPCTCYAQCNGARNFSVHSHRSNP